MLITDFISSAQTEPECMNVNSFNIILFCSSLIWHQGGTMFCKTLKGSYHEESDFPCSFEVKRLMHYKIHCHSNHINLPPPQTIQKWHLLKLNSKRMTYSVLSDTFCPLLGFYSCTFLTCSPVHIENSQEQKPGLQVCSTSNTDVKRLWTKMDVKVKNIDHYMTRTNIKMT